MKVLEIKNNLVKIAYDVKDNLALSGFVIIEDENNPYVAQVMNLKTDSDSNFAIVKLLFTFDKEGILKNYNGTIPSLNAAVSSLPATELLDIIPLETPLILGELAQQKCSLKVDRSILESNLLVCSNSLENTTLFLNNIITQIDGTKVIFDTDGQYDWDKKITFGKDFRLPLNYDTINFIYENELDDVDATSKAIIQDIFLEVQEYTKTLAEGFLPFSTFLNVVDAQYKETQITQLVLLKNKLMKYKELNVFAENIKEILALSINVEDNDTLVIDISDMNAPLQKEIIQYTYKVLNSINNDIYSFIKINNDIADKKLLKTVLANTNVYSTVICPHEYKYINELKENSQNIVLFTPLTVQHDFASYNTYLNKLNSDEFIIYGAHTQNIPLIVELKDFNEEEIEENDDETNDIENPFNSIKDDFSDDDFSDEISFEEDDAQNIIEEEVSTDETFEEPEEVQDEIVEETEKPELISIDENIEIVESDELEEESQPVIENILSDENDDLIFNEQQAEEPQIIENILADEPAEEPEIIEADEIEFDKPQEEIEENTEELSHDELVEQVSKDVDRAFYEKLPEENDDISFDELQEDVLTEDDLNLIDNFSDEEIQLAGDEDDEADFSELEAENTEEEIEEEEVQDETPIVPVFDADDIERVEVPELEAGDRVSTAKYGEGVVEKMIKYGNKMLCSIDFPNIGRRLLDPAMTEITKLS